MGETKEHREIKNLIAAIMKEWYGLGVSEYPDAGHEDDVISVVDSKKILFEVIWTPGNFDRDLNIIALSDARVKVAIANPKIISDDERVRRYEKQRVELEQRGERTSELIDGTRVLSDPSYVEGAFRTEIGELLRKASPVTSQHEKPYFIVRLASQNPFLQTQPMAIFYDVLVKNIGRGTAPNVDIKVDDGITHLMVASLTRCVFGPEQEERIAIRIDVQKSNEWDVHVTKITDLEGNGYPDLHEHLKWP